jgi:hypothetical protein
MFYFVDLCRLDRRYVVRVHCAINPIKVIFASVFEGLIIAVIFPELVRPVSLVTVTHKVTFVSPLTWGAMNDGDAVSASFQNRIDYISKIGKLASATQFLSF